MTDKSVSVAVVGAGAISDTYLRHMIASSSLQIDSICSAHMESAREKAMQYGLRARTYKEILNDASVDMVVNLTPTHVHYEIIKQALLAGKHVYTEKTLTDHLSMAKELLQIAEEKHLHLGAAPDTFLSAPFQTARKLIEGGMIGEVNSFVVAANRDNCVLLSRFSFLRMPGGDIAHDYGVYYLTALVYLLGPVKCIAAITRTPYPTHINILSESPDFGKTMDTPNESQISAILQLANGITGTFHLNADSNWIDQAHFAIYGTKGILYLPDPCQLCGELQFVPNSRHKETLKTETVALTCGILGQTRGVGPIGLAQAIRGHSPNRTSKEMAYHVQEVLSAMLRCGEKGGLYNINSRFEQPAPLERLCKA